MKILFSDDRVIVCIKPPGILSTDEPGGMPALLRSEIGSPETTVKSVHRLDRMVGGVMVYARTRRAASDLGRQIMEGTFEKRYLAVVQGAPSKSAGTLQHFLLRDRIARRTDVVAEGIDGAKEAILDYAVLDSREGMSLLSVHLHTGRPHQIRTQLAHIGHPIVGDRKYGKGSEGDFPALWSHEIRFVHPRTGETMAFCHSPPDAAPWNVFYSV